MNTSVSVHVGTASDGRQAVVEVGAITGPDGTVHEANGAFLSDELIVGYVSMRDNRPWLTTWDGTPIMALTCTGSARGFHRTRLHCYRGTFAGRSWSGRGLGEGMILRLRPGRHVS